MFRITEDPSSGNLVQCLVEITKMVLSRPLTWTWSVLRQHILTRCAYRKALLPSYTVNNTRTTGPPLFHVITVRICCHNPDNVYVNGHDRTNFVILTKHCTRLPDDGSYVIRNMLEHVYIFYNFNCIYELYICALAG